MFDSEITSYYLLQHIKFSFIDKDYCSYMYNNLELYIIKL